MKYILTLSIIVLSSCGVEVTGLRDVKVTHEVSVESIKKYIEAYCSLGNSTPEDIEACVDVEIGKLITKL